LGLGLGFGCDELAIVRDRAALEGDEVAVTQLVRSGHVLAVDQGQVTPQRARGHVCRVGVGEQGGGLR
jgi:hypothetical protein